MVCFIFMFWPQGMMMHVTDDPSNLHYANKNMKINPNKDLFHHQENTSTTVVTADNWQ